MIEMVSATRLSQTDFFNRSALGVSLQRLLPAPRMAQVGIDDVRRVAAYIAFENRRGLPDIYNERITAEEADAILVFVHDDVWIEDFFLAHRLLDALKTYDVVGVAGNRRRLQNQCAWAYVDDKFTRDEHANLSGLVAHGPTPLGKVTFFGETPAQCELLDGVFLAARRSVLRAASVLFDPRFDFHFYDLDFCRTARLNGLRLGTWPISITHQSSGSAKNDRWRQKRDAYLEKWKS
jgi:GT2 family glycosyltransferase